MYNPQQYWESRPTIAHKYSFHQTQEDKLMYVLRGLDFNTVFEVGCGWGRIGKRLITMEQVKKYTGIDYNQNRLLKFDSELSKDQKDEVDITLGQCAYLAYPFEIAKAENSVDLVIAVEVLMHIKPEDIKHNIERMKRHTKKYIVSVDFVGPIEHDIGEHNFLHDYETLYGTVEQIKMGRQAIFVWSK